MTTRQMGGHDLRLRPHSETEFSQNILEFCFFISFRNIFYIFYRFRRDKDRWDIPYLPLQLS